MHMRNRYDDSLHLHIINFCLLHHPILTTAASTLSLYFLNKYLRLPMIRSSCVLELLFLYNHILFFDFKIPLITRTNNFQFYVALEYFHFLFFFFNNNRLDYQDVLNVYRMATFPITTNFGINRCKRILLINLSFLSNMKRTTVMTKILPELR